MRSLMLCLLIVVIGCATVNAGQTGYGFANAQFGGGFGGGIASGGHGSYGAPTNFGTNRYYGAVIYGGGHGGGGYGRK